MIIKAIGKTIQKGSLFLLPALYGCIGAGGGAASLLGSLFGGFGGSAFTGSGGGSFLTTGGGGLGGGEIILTHNPEPTSMLLLGSGLLVLKLYRNKVKR